MHLNDLFISQIYIGRGIFHHCNLYQLLQGDLTFYLFLNEEIGQCCRI